MGRLAGWLAATPGLRDVLPGASRRGTGPGILRTMHPTRGEIIASAILVLVLVALIVAVVASAIPPGGPPTLH